MRQGSSIGSHTTVQRHGIARDLTVCGLFTALTAVGASIRIAIPVGADTINFTLQWFFALPAGLLPGSRRVSLNAFAYLLTGLVGTPVFTRGGEPSYLTRPTFGSPLGFALAAYVMGEIVEWMYALEPGTCLFSATVGYVIYYGTGVLYFYSIAHPVVVIPDTVGWGAISAIYCLPTTTPDHMLCILTMTVTGRLRPSTGRLME